MTVVVDNTNVVRAGVPSSLDSGCPACGFSLWLPIAELSVSRVGLYDDARFPGRVIVSAIEHFDHLDDVEPSYLAQFMVDVQRVSSALRSLGDVERTNMAILGNRDAHVHAHVFPRRLDDANAGRAPWDQAPPHTKLSPETRNRICSEIRYALLG
ncbi:MULTISPECIES: HIT family protein [Gordonia]|nr:HIT family protein [Gordonia aichiensis]